MTALILAAGMGKRMFPLTKDIPKALIQIHKGKSLLENILDKLVAIKDLNEIVIVLGYKGEKIIDKLGNKFQGIPINYVWNKDFEDSNNIYSLYLAKSLIKGDVLLIECDLIFTNDLLGKIIDESDCNILVSKFNPEIMNGTVIEIQNDKIISLLLKNEQTDLDMESKYYKTVNIYKFSSAFMKNFFQHIESFINHNGKNSFYEVVLKEFIGNDQYNIKTTIIDDDMWFEVDEIEELNKVKKHLKEEKHLF